MTAIAQDPDITARRGLPRPPHIIRGPLRGLGPGRIVMGGRLDDAGRLGRYGLWTLAPAAARLEDMPRDFAVAEAVFASAIARTQSSEADVYASYPLVQVLAAPSLPAPRPSPRRRPALAAGGAGMPVMLAALWAGHLGWGLDAKQTIKSTIGWAKDRALLALFPLAGAALPIRRAVLARAQCAVGRRTPAPLMLAAPYPGQPEKIFTSPLKAAGGPGPEYFTVSL